MGEDESTTYTSDISREGERSTTDGEWIYPNFEPVDWSVHDHHSVIKQIQYTTATSAPFKYHSSSEQNTENSITTAHHHRSSSSESFLITTTAASVQ